MAAIGQFSAYPASMAPGKRKYIHFSRAPIEKKSRIISTVHKNKQKLNRPNRRKEMTVHEHAIDGRRSVKWSYSWSGREILMTDRRLRRL